MILKPLLRIPRYYRLPAIRTPDYYGHPTLTVTPHHYERPKKRGIISLIPKKDKDKKYLKNWRQISLLNNDYKIVTKALDLRLEKVLPTIISPNQTGYVKGRYIGESFRIVTDIEDITCPQVDMNFIFEWSTRYLTSERSSLVRYRVDHEKIKFISISGHVIFCLLYKHQ